MARPYALDWHAVTRRGTPDKPLDTLLPNMVILVDPTTRFIGYGEAQQPGFQILQIASLEGRALE